MAVGTVLVTVVTRGEDMIGGLLPEAFAHIMGGTVPSSARLSTGHNRPAPKGTTSISSSMTYAGWSMAWTSSSNPASHARLRKGPMISVDSIVVHGISY